MIKQGEGELFGVVGVRLGRGGAKRPGNAASGGGGMRAGPVAREDVR